MLGVGEKYKTHYHVILTFLFLVSDHLFHSFPCEKRLFSQKENAIFSMGKQCFLIEKITKTVAVTCLRKLFIYSHSQQLVAEWQQKLIIYHIKHCINTFCNICHSIITRMRTNSFHLVFFV